jgi:hypothetical protein
MGFELYNQLREQPFFIFGLFGFVGVLVDADHIPAALGVGFMESCRPLHVLVLLVAVGFAACGGGLYLRMVLK